MGKRVFFGTRKYDKRGIFLSYPEWQCGWYWSFGYLGNKDEHYHLSSYNQKPHSFKLEDGSFKHITESRNKNMQNCLLEDYELNPNIERNIWKFCELAKTVYVLKETAEVLGRGGAHYTENPCKDIIINKDEVTRINRVVLPAIFKEIEDLVEGKGNYEPQTQG